MSAKDLPDKKHAPKKTGKRMLPPEDKTDAVKDLDKPSKGGSLLVEQPPKPTVVGDRMQAYYNKPLYSKLPKSGDVVISFVMSFPLEKEHKELLPKIVAEGYHDIAKRGRKTLGFKELPGQAVKFFLSHDDKDEVLSLPAARMVQANLALVERKGEGSARKVVRFSFRFQVKYEAHIAKFADVNLGNQFWITLEEAQTDLFEDEEEGDE